MRQLLKITTTFALTLVFSVGMAFGQSNNSTIDQDTDNNSASVEQVGSALQADVTQKGGDENSATIRQNNTEGGADITSTVLQDGALNQSIVNASRRNSRSATTLQQQFGNRNDAFINLDETGDLGTDEGTSLIQFQNGNRNFARMSGSNSYSAEQRQVGNDNLARVQGVRKTVDAFQRQVGDDNVARLNGSGLGFNDPTQKQFGDGNRSVLDQVTDDGSSLSEGASDAFYSTFQDGNNNTIELTGNGYGASFDASQDGNGNTLETALDGDGNIVDSDQGGNTNSATLDLLDEANNVELGQFGNSNSATVTFQSSANSTTITQSGNGNTATVNGN